MQEITLKAYGKINLALFVGKKRDDGYHDLSSVMQSVNLYDLVTLKKRTDGQITLSTNSEEIPSDRTNIAYKAAELMMKKFGILTGFDIFIDKKIPVGGGMAGGSTNAAAVIEGINTLCELNLSLEEMCALGKEIGADVPFCLFKRTAHARGIGEKLEEVSGLLNCYIVLVNPKVFISTGKIFSMMDEEEREYKECAEILEALKEWNFEKICACLENDMQKYTASCCDEIEKIIKALKNAGAGGAIMSGSGSTCFGLFKEKPNEEDLEKKLGEYWHKVVEPLSFS